MQVFQTCGVPPSLGKMVLPMIGCTKNKIKALTNNVMAKRAKAKGLPPGLNGASSSVGFSPRGFSSTKSVVPL